MPRRNQILSEQRQSSRYYAAKLRRRNGGRLIIPPDHLAVPPLLVSKLRPPLARQHTGLRRRYLNIRPIISRFGSVTRTQRQYIAPLYCRKWDLLVTRIVPKRYWTARLLIPKILTSGLPSFLRRHNTHMLCWGMRALIPLYPFLTFKVTGNVPMRIRHLPSVVGTTDIIRGRVLINTFPRFTLQS